MDAAAHQLLIVESDAGAAADLRRTLLQAPHATFDVQTADSLLTACQLLSREQFDVVLLNLNLRDCFGLSTLTQLRAVCPRTPVVVLTTDADEQLALGAVREGAQDYLVRSEVTPRQLCRSVRYAFERQRLREELRSMALIDDLTGLYNRRAFLAVAQLQLKMNQRTGRPLALLFIDLDGLKELNDRHGHQMGDQALRETADALRETFRESDVLARLHGDEFTVLAFEIGDSGPDSLVERLRDTLRRRNLAPDRAYSLEMSIGAAWTEPGLPATLEDLLTRADRSLYLEKSSKKVLR
ncbi:MAG: diguanylate cyclase [Planctomycetia bacterium]